MSMGSHSCGKMQGLGTAMPTFPFFKWCKGLLSTQLYHKCTDHCKIFFLLKKGFLSHFHDTSTCRSSCCNTTMGMQNTIGSRQFFVDPSDTRETLLRFQEATYALIATRPFLSTHCYISTTMSFLIVLWSLQEIHF